MRSDIEFAAWVWATLYAGFASNTGANRRTLAARTDEAFREWASRFVNTSTPPQTETPTTPPNTDVDGGRPEPAGSPEEGPAVADSEVETTA